MPFNYSVQLDDPSNLGGPADAVLVYDLQQALGVWSDYINGVGTLVVDLKIANTPTGRASGGPTSSVFVGTNSSGLNVFEPSSFYELTTGNHVNGTTSDITVTVSPSYFPNLDLASGLTYGSQVPANEYNPIVVFLHELAHGLGWSGFYSQAGVFPGNVESTYDTLIQITPSGTAFFTGPNTEAIYGGPLQLTSSSTTQNYYHIGNTLSDISRPPANVQDPLTLDLMNGVVFYFDHQYPVSDIDLGVLRDLGYSIVPAQFVAAGDFDSDSDPAGDLLWQKPDGSVVAWDLNGAQLEGQASLGQVPANWHAVASADFNADHNSDVLLQDSAGDLLMWLMNGSSVASQQIVSQIPSNWQVAGTADFNGDHNADILLHSNAGGLIALEMNGTQIIGNQFIGQIPSNWHVGGTGDFNGDGKSDIVLLSDAGGIIVLEMNGAQIIANQFIGQIPGNWHVAGTGDFNADGKSDILLHSDAGGLIILEMNGTQIIANQFIGQIPPNWHVDGIADANGDGKSDIILTSDAGASLLLEMNGTQIVLNQLISPNASPAAPPLDAHAAPPADASTGVESVATIAQAVDPAPVFDAGSASHADAGGLIPGTWAASFSGAGVGGQMFGEAGTLGGVNPHLLGQSSLFAYDPHLLA